MKSDRKGKMSDQGRSQFISVGGHWGLPLCKGRSTTLQTQGLLLDLPIQSRGPIKGVHAQGPVDYCLVNGESSLSRRSICWKFSVGSQCWPGWRSASFTVSCLKSKRLGSEAQSYHVTSQQQVARLFQPPCHRVLEYLQVSLGEHLALG